MTAMYDPRYTKAFYDAYGLAEWSRLEATAYGRLQAIIHTDFLERYLRSGYRVLDAGSGPGRFSALIAKLGGRVTVLDISRRQLDLARERLTEAKLLANVEGFLEGDIVDLSMLPDGHFDLVVCYGGALSYVCEQRERAAAQLLRVTRPGGVLLVSVMSRFGVAANAVRSPLYPFTVVKDPEGSRLFRIIREGDSSGAPSTKVHMQHAPMHLYSAEELQALFTNCAMLELAGSNVSTFEGSSYFEELATDPEAWATVVEVERALNHVPGLVDSGSHVIMATRRPASE